MNAAHSITPVAFDGFDGTTLRGDLYRPAVDAPTPGIVMTHGFSAVRTMALPEYATILAAAGLTVLVYDHRNLGDSDGQPRQEINPWAQCRDMVAALDRLADDPDVDGRRLGVWGSSFSGGESLVVAAVDDRVRAVAANVPFAGLTADPPGPDASERFAAIADQLRADPPDLAGPGGEITGPLRVVSDDGRDVPAFLEQPESAEWFLTAGAGTTWRNEVTLRNAFGTDPAFDPALAAAHLGTTAALFVIAAGDRVADVAIARATYERVTGPKRLVEIDGHHFAPYSGAALTTAAEAARDFFVERLSSADNVS